MQNTGVDNYTTYNPTEETPNLSSPDNIQNEDTPRETPVENYINYNYFKSKIDGKSTEHTFFT